MERAIEGPEIEASVVSEEGVVLGAFQRRSEISIEAIARRASGGAAVRVGKGTVHVVLALPTPDVLVVDCDPRKILNRYVRPLLKAITRVSVLAAYFGRDWVSAAHKPCAYVAFAHDSITQRTTFESFVAVSTPFHIEARPSFLGKEPTTLDAIAKKDLDPNRVKEEIVNAYASAYALDIERRPIEDDVSVPSMNEPPWIARMDEAIGTIWADRGHIGGELMASRDAVQRVNSRLARAKDDVKEISAIIDSELSQSTVALEGIKSLSSLMRAVAKARGIEIG
jgi:hypothetical protein